jgi:hypothetical protein
MKGLHNVLLLKGSMLLIDHCRSTENEEGAFKKNYKKSKTMLR